MQSDLTFPDACLTVFSICLLGMDFGTTMRRKLQ